MDQRAYDKFSGNQWILIEKLELDESLLGSYSHTVPWKDAFADQTAEKEWWKAHLFEVVISPLLNGYHIIEGKPLVYEQIASQLLTDLSEYGKVYWFRIDLYQTVWQFKVFEKKQCIREYEFYYDNKANKIAEINKGQALPIEEMASPLLTEEEYQEFWTPLAIMEVLGINESMLLDALHHPCRVIMIPDECKKIMEEANSTLNL